MNPTSTGMFTWVLVAVAVVCNSMAQVMIKRANVVDAFRLSSWLDAWLIGALALYGISFVITALVYARLPLTVISPMMAGAIFLLISLLSGFMLNEVVTLSRLAGMALIVAGVYLISRSV